MVWGYILHSFPHTECLDLAKLSVSALALEGARNVLALVGFKLSEFMVGHRAVIALGLIREGFISSVQSCRVAWVLCEIRVTAAGLAGLTRASVLAAPAGWAVLALLPGPIKLCSPSEEAELHFSPSAESFPGDSTAMPWVAGEEQ